MHRLGDVMKIQLPAIRVEYRGREADDHRIDLGALATSMGGMSRLLGSASYVLAKGELPPKHYKPKIRYFAKPPEHGCFPYDIIGEVDGDMFQVTSQMFAAIGGEAVQRIVSAAFLFAGGRSSEVDSHITRIVALAEKMEADRHEEQMALLGKWANSDKHVEKVLEMFAEISRGNAVNAAKPVGESSNDLRVGNTDAGGVVVDLPTAQAIRSKGKLTAGDMQKYKVMVDSITAHNKTVGLYLEAAPHKVVRGDLVDPAALAWPNIYQNNVTRFLEITAKPVLTSDGEIHRLSVFDAKSIDENDVSEKLKNVARSISESRRGSGVEQA